jgi:Flp pilus assembly protein CpaB
VPRGLRAVSVAIKDGAALAGFLNPGNLVDVLVTVVDPDAGPQGGPEGGEEVTTTLLQAVYVLGVDSRMGAETADQATAARGRHDPTVTLLVDPADAERVAHADFSGDIRLTLRTNTDAALVATPKPKGKEKAVRPRPDKVAAAPVLVPCKEVWIFHGADRTVLMVDDRGKPVEPGTCATPSLSRQQVGR